MKKVKITNRRRLVLVVSMVVLTTLLSLVLYRTITKVRAWDRTWSQTDWRGGTSPGVITENSETYLEKEGIESSEEGLLSVEYNGDWNVNYMDWLYRKKITFDNTEDNIGVVPEDLIDFPVLVKLESGVNIDYDKTNNDGSDIRFADTDGTELSYEIESWDESGDSFVWVKVPQIDIGDEDYIYIYYGNSSAIDGENATDVWSNGYAGVWHMNNNPESIGPQILDSLDQHNGTATGSMGSSQLVDGLLGKGLFFDTTNTVELGLSSDLKPEDITIESWVNVGSGSYYLGVISSMQSWGTGFSLNVYPDSRIGAMVSGAYLNGVTVPQVDNWYYITATHDSTTDLNTIYINGIAERNNTRPVSYLENAVTTIGCFYTSGSLKFHGIIDDIKISNVVRSSSWIAAKYYSDTSNFSTFESEENKFEFPVGTLTSNVFDPTYPSDWGELSYDSSGSGIVEVRVRTDMNEGMNGVLDWSECDAITNGTLISLNNCVDDQDRYIQYHITLEPEGSNTPVFENISISFSASDQTAPILNANNLYISNNVENDQWVNFIPTINWTVGEDDTEGGGLEGYCISLNEVNPNDSSQSLDPRISSGVFTGLDDGVSSTACPYIVMDTNIDLDYIDGLDIQSNKKYYFSIKAVDYAGNVWDGASENYQDLVWFKYDSINPQNVMYISTPSSIFGSVNDMFFTWPIEGQAVAADDESGLLGWQYSINSHGYEDWMGTEEHSFLGVSYIPLISEISSISLNEETHGDLVNIGNNTIYFRSIDVAGNVSTYVTGGINYGGAAPTFPAESGVTVTPQTSDSNSFGLGWPEAIPGDGRVIESYYYMINTQPPGDIETLKGNSSIYIPTTGMSVIEGVLVGAVKGSNNVYVVAVDDDDNYSPSNAIQGTFVLNSDLPDPPQNLSVSDTSIKEAEIWRVALTWDPPEYKGNGNISYIIEKSLDGISWVELDRITGNAYSDTSDRSREYFYRVGSIDTSDESKISPSCAPALSINPKGRFTTAPNLISKPVVAEVSTRSAKVTWVTDRNSDSKLQYGISSGEYFDSEIYTSTKTTEHVLEINNLLPGIGYFVRAKWTDEDGNTGSSDEFLLETKPAPRVEDVNISTVGLDYAILDITTVGAINANVLYGKTKSYGGSKEINTSTASSEYSVMLTELEDGIEYHYTIILTDEEGYKYDGFGDLVFETPPRPQVSNVQIQEKKGVPTPTIEVFWESNIAVNSIVKYSNEGKSLDKVDMELIEGEHVMEIEGLDPNSSYQLTVEGVDSMGNRAVSDVYAFTTATDTRPPEVSSIKSEGDIQSSDIQSDRTRSAQLIISWQTDEPSTSQILYGEGASSDGFPYSTQTDSQMRYEHVIIVSNLSPSKVYHFKVVSKDSAGNVGESGSVTSITPKSTDTVMESVLGSLGRIFRFL